MYHTRGTAQLNSSVIQIWAQHKRVDALWVSGRGERRDKADTVRQMDTGNDGRLGSIRCAIAELILKFISLKHAVYILYADLPPPTPISTQHDPTSERRAANAPSRSRR